MGFLAHVIKLLGDNQGYRQMLEDSAKMTESWVDKVKKGVKGAFSASAGIKLLKDELTEINALADQAKEIKLGAMRLGTTISEFQRMKTEAERANMSVEDLVGNMERLAVAQTNLATGSNENGLGEGAKSAKYWRALGFSPEAVMALSPQQMMQQMQGRFAGQQLRPAELASFRKLRLQGLIPMIQQEGKVTDYFGQLSETDVAGGNVMKGDLSALKKAPGKFMRALFPFFPKGGGIETDSTKDAPFIFSMLHYAGNALKFLQGTPYKDLKSPEDAIKGERDKISKFKDQQDAGNKTLAAMEMQDAIDKHREQIEQSISNEVEKQDKIRREAALIGLSGEEKIQQMQKDRVELEERAAQIMKDAEAEEDPMKYYKLLKDYNEVQTQIEEASKNIKQAEFHSGKGAFKAEGLEQAGIFLGTRNDGLVDINRQQLNELQRVRRAVEKQNAGKNLNQLAQ